MRILMILFLLAYPYPLPEDEQTFMAMLKPGEGEVDATQNDQIVFTVIEGDRFLYDNVNHHAYLSDGQFGYLDPEKVKKTDDVSVFKFEFADEAFVLPDNDALMLLGRKKKIDFKNIIKRVLQQDPEAFTAYVLAGSKVNGSAVESYESMFWKLINDWDDVELNKLLKAADTNTRKSFLDLMVDVNVTWPVEEPRDYFEKYYPRTFERFIHTY